MPPPVLHHAHHAAKLWLPVPRPHAYQHAKTWFVSLHELSPNHVDGGQKRLPARPFFLSLSGNNSITALHQKMYRRLHTALHIVRHRTNVPSKVHVAPRCS